MGVYGVYARLLHPTGSHSNVAAGSTSMSIVDTILGPSSCVMYVVVVI